MSDRGALTPDPSRARPVVVSVPVPVFLHSHLDIRSPLPRLSYSMYHSRRSLIVSCRVVSCRVVSCTASARLLHDLSSPPGPREARSHTDSPYRSARKDDNTSHDGLLASTHPTVCIIAQKRDMIGCHSSHYSHPVIIPEKERRLPFRTFAAYMHMKTRSSDEAL